MVPISFYKVQLYLGTGIRVLLYSRSISRAYITAVQTNSTNTQQYTYSLDLTAVCKRLIILVPLGTRVPF